MSVAPSVALLSVVLIWLGVVPVLHVQVVPDPVQPAALSVTTQIATAIPSAEMSRLTRVPTFSH